ncbi:MAG: 50S ribosomal protein L15 [Chromatiales bacterium]|jgi:large subunit ribosomal protein L15|nr:50S ribosomal protein L15 [Chromatiales bacterium]MDP6151536.1 50S ribosomal protein L15 [Gammaproteobacteria bacterium]MDP7271446.1 50S ribosomal protein L15 [Gammaproteobacteria bacterium]HJP05706.1 50S ribosomal protein L15 [Gammaproteobacteria bacterium]
MKLNSISPADGSKKTGKRRGRGHAAGQGKTCGRGQKGQHARSGGYHKVGFEGGQMPLQRRLPKVGFRSAKAHSYAEVRLSELGAVEDDVIDILALKRAGIVAQQTTRAKVFASGEIDKAVKLKGVGVTKGARAAIEKAGGSIEE